MKILKIFGVVAGIHVLALLLIFADPGCSVGKSQSTRPDTGTPPEASPITPAPTGTPPISFSPESPAPGGALYPPTRPGTPAAASIEAQPVSGVTPAATYVVSSGDSLWSIAKRNHIKISDLATANDLRSGATIHPGQKLIIPQKSLAGQAGAADEGGPAPARARRPAGAPAESVHYVVRPGESLRAIAHRYHVKLSDIAAANSISDPKSIQPGQELVIPGGRLSAAGSSASRPPASASPQAPAEAAPAPAQIPGSGQDLDSGLKPAAGGDVPVVKVDDSASQQK